MRLWIIACLFMLPTLSHAAGKPSPAITTLAYRADGGQLAAGTYGRVELIDPIRGTVTATIPELIQQVTALAYRADGQRLVVASGEPGKSGELRLFANPPAKPLWTLPTAHKDRIPVVAFSVDGAIIASASYDRRIQLWDAETGKLVRTLTDHSDSVYDLAFHPGGKLLASVSADRAVKVWDIATGNRLYTLSDATDWLYAVAWSPDGKHLAAGGVDRSLRIWQADAIGGKLVKSAFAHQGAILRIVMAKDGKSIFTTGEDRIVKRWDAATLIEQAVFPAQPDSVLALALRPDGAQLAVGRFDGVLTLISAVDGKPQAQPLPAPVIAPKPPNGVSLTPAFAPRGQTSRLIIAGTDLDHVTAVTASFPGVTVTIPSQPRKPDSLAIDVLIPPMTRLEAGSLILQSASTPAAKPLNLTIDRFPSRSESDIASQPLTTPATIRANLSRAGEVDTFGITLKAGEMIGAHVEANAGAVFDPVIDCVSSAGERIGESNLGYLAIIAPMAGEYRIRVRDREFRGGVGYRLHLGPIPLVTSIFPAGAMRGTTAEIRIHGVFVPTTPVKVAIPADAKNGSIIPVPLGLPAWETVLGKANLLVGSSPEINSPGELSVPGTGNGVITQGDVPQMWRFPAKKGQPLIIETHAQRLGSTLDSAIEIVDANGVLVERATLRCQAKTTVAFRNHDSKKPAIRLDTWNELAPRDLVYVDEELMRIDALPKGPDDDCQFEQIGGARVSYLGTTPRFHAQGLPVYKVSVHPPGTNFPPNGMPIFRLPYRNDDGGPRFGDDSMLEFDPPADGIYQVRISSANGSGSRDHVYRVTVRPPQPDFVLRVTPTTPAVWKGNGVSIGIDVDRIDGFTGRIAIEMENLPVGFTAPPTFIDDGKSTTAMTLYADATAPKPMGTPLKWIARANRAGQAIVHEVVGGVPTLIEPGDLQTRTQETAISIQPGQETKLTVEIDRLGDFKGRVPLEVRGLPYGVRVQNIGLNGILILPTQKQREIVLYAEPWVMPTTQPIVILSRSERKGSEHATKPVMLKVGP